MIDIEKEMFGETKQYQKDDSSLLMEMFEKQEKLLREEAEKRNSIDNMFMSPKEVEFNNLRTQLILNGVLKERPKPKQKNNKRKKKKKRK